MQENKLRMLTRLGGMATCAASWILILACSTMAQQLQRVESGSVQRPSAPSVPPGPTIGGERNLNPAPRTEPNGPAPAQSSQGTVPITIDELAQYARLEVEFTKLQKSYGELLRRTQGGIGTAANGGSVRRLLERMAQNFEKAIQDGVFCSVADVKIDGNLIVRIGGKVRDQTDVEKAKSVIERDGSYGLLKSAGLVDLTIQADGGEAGGCVLAFAPGLTLTKRSKDAFTIITHGELAKDKGMFARLPEKRGCGEIGRLFVKLREDPKNVPPRQKDLFISFWVRDGSQLTLCREQGEDWETAPAYRVKDGWDGLLVLSSIK